MSKPALNAAIVVMDLPLVAEARRPAFAAPCDRGVNLGGYNIDADSKGHPSVDGHRVNLTELASVNREGGYRGAMLSITRDGSGTCVARSDNRGKQGLRGVTAALASGRGECWAAERPLIRAQGSMSCD